MDLKNSLQEFEKVSQKLCAHLSDVATEAEADSLMAALSSIQEEIEQLVYLIEQSEIYQSLLVGIREEMSDD